MERSKKPASDAKILELQKRVNVTGERLADLQAQIELAINANRAPSLGGTAKGKPPSQSAA
jgi:hypothetical protein